MGNALQVLEKIAALRGPKPLPASASFQVSDSNAEQSSSFMALQRLSDGHLVGLQLHGGQPDVGAVDELKAVLEEKQGAAIRPVVLLHIQAGGPRLREERALVAQSAEERLKGVKVVVDFLQA